MSSYTSIPTGFVKSSRFLELSDDARQIFFQLINDPKSNIAGVVRIPPAYLSNDLRYPIDRVLEAYYELQSRGYIRYCERTNWVWICEQWRWASKYNENQWKGTLPYVKEIDINCTWLIDFKGFFKDRLEQECPKLLEKSDHFYTLLIPHTDPINSLSKTNTNTNTNTNTSTSSTPTESAETRSPVDEKKTVGKKEVKPKKNTEEVNKRMQTLIATYAEAYKARYDTNPPPPGGRERGIVKRLAENSMSVERMCELIRHYLTMTDAWFEKKYHDWPTFETNLTAVSTHYETDHVPVQRYANGKSVTYVNQALLDQYEKPRGEL